MSQGTMAEGAIVRHADAIVHDLGRSGGSLMDAKKRLNGEGSMFVNVNATPGNRPKFLGEHGSLARTQFILSEFKYSRGAEIFGESEPAEYVYQVVEGAVRSYKLLSDGRRQIGAFHLVGDVFGLESGSTHRFTTEAIVDTTVRLIKRRSLEHVAEADVRVALDILNMTATNLQH